MEYCCEVMETALSRGELYYDAVSGAIIFYVKSAWNEPGVYYGSYASYCPYCGAKLHDSLVLEYEDELEKAVGKEFCDIKAEEIPDEFKSDEWWKKRGL